MNDERLSRLAVNAAAPSSGADVVRSAEHLSLMQIGRSDVTEKL